jgi:putative oxidoreductase
MFSGTLCSDVVAALSHLAEMIISAGYQDMLAPGGRVGKAANTLAKMRRVVPLPIDDELIVRANGGTQLAAGAALALGAKPRSQPLCWPRRCCRPPSQGTRFGRLLTPQSRKGNGCSF